MTVKRSDDVVITSQNSKYHHPVLEPFLPDTIAFCFKGFYKENVTLNRWSYVETLELCLPSFQDVPGYGGIHSHCNYLNKNHSECVA